MDLGPLPGDSQQLRAAAADLQAAVPPLRTAHVAAVRVEQLLDGEHWRGEAFDAFRRAVERKPLPAALERAIEVMGEAAQQLGGFADRFDDHQQRLAHLRAQAAAVQASFDPADPASVAAAEAELRSIEHRARAVHDDHRAALALVAAAFGQLSDEPTFAEPPPSTWERFTGALGDAAGVAWSFGTGVVEGVRDLALGIWELGRLLDPTRWDDLWAGRHQLWAVLAYAWEHPLEFAAALGTALLDLDILRDDPARWLGRRIPDIVLALATGGAGAVGARAASSVRGIQALRPVTSAGQAATRLRGADGIAGAFARIGVDEARFVQHGTGAFARTDTAVGRLATSLDGALPGVATLRQLPGLGLDTIRAVTDIPADAVLARIPGALGSPVAPVARRTFANLATGGLTGRLGIVDGLLVGAPALSPAAYGTIAGVGALSVADAAADVHGAVQSVLAIPPR